MIDFCKDIGLQSSTAVTRNATIKLIGMLHKFVGPGHLLVLLYFLICYDMIVARSCS